MAVRCAPGMGCARNPRDSILRQTSRTCSSVACAFITTNIALLLGKSQSNECAPRLAMTSRFPLLCSTHGDEMGARSQGHPEASCPGDSSQAHVAPNWDSYFDIRRTGDRCRTCVSPRLQHLP